MAAQNDPPKDQPQQDPPETGNDDPEAGYWDKLSKLIDDRISHGIDKKIADIRGTSQQRGTGRTTVPRIIADFVFGPEKSKTE